MIMKPAAITSYLGGLINIKAQKFDGKCLIECFDANRFIQAVHTNSKIEHPQQVASDCWLRGFVVPDEGAFFDLMDSYGVACANFLVLNQQDASTKILDRLIWEV